MRGLAHGEAIPEVFVLYFFLLDININRHLRKDISW